MHEQRLQSQDQPPPDLVLTHERVACARHGEPFHIGWPAGFGVFAIRGFRVCTAAGMNVRSGPNFVADVMKALTERPVCCRLKSSELLSLYLESRPDWPVESCQLCSVKSKGAVMRMNSRDTVGEFFCFECIVGRLRALPISGDG